MYKLILVKLIDGALKKKMHTEGSFTGEAILNRSGNQTTSLNYQITPTLNTISQCGKMGGKWMQMGYVIKKKKENKKMVSNI